MNYQLLFTADLVVLQMKLVQILRVQVTSLQITFAGISEEGSLIEYHQGVACQLRQEDFYREKISQHRNSMENIRTVCDSVSVLLDIHETSVTTTTSSGAVSSSEFLEALGSLVIVLSEDINSLDASDVLAIQSLSISNTFSDREKAKLVGIKTTLVSYIVQLGSEIAMAHSELQDLEMQKEISSNTDIGALEKNVAIITNKTQKLLQISEYVKETGLGCSLTNPTESEEFLDFVLDNVLLAFARADVRSEIQPDSSIWDMLGPLQEYYSTGIKCPKGSDNMSMLVIQAVLEVYIDMLNLDLTSVQEKILELEGVCPPGYELGDWSDGSGDCCCSSDVTLGDEDSRLTNERPANSSIEICYEKKVCECRPCQKPCLVEKLTGLFASFDALDQTTQAIDTVTSCSAVTSGPEEFIKALESLMAVLARYTPRDLF